MNKSITLNITEAEKYKQMLRDNGICTECGTPYAHHMVEPFASCSCRTSEWVTLDTPFMKLQVQIRDLRTRLKESMYGRR